MDRQQHLEWAKERARQYLKAGDYPQALASMLSDLGKHPETAGSVEFGCFLMLAVRDVADARRFVEGFN